jgi:putative membrane protein
MPDALPPEDPRVRFAAERTLLAWVRTGLAMMGFGFVVAKFGVFLRQLPVLAGAADPPDVRWSVWFGVALVMLGVLVNGLSVLEYRAVLRRIDRGEPYRPPMWSLGLAAAVVLAGIGLAMVGYLIAV